jgi:membrane protein
VLFTVGKIAIGYYIGASGASQGFGAAGTLVVILLWIYYSAVIFLLGAEFTRAWSGKEEAKPEDVRAQLQAEAAPPRPDPKDTADLKAIATTAAVAGGLSLLRQFWRGRRALN